MWLQTARYIHKVVIFNKSLISWNSIGFWIKIMFMILLPGILGNNSIRPIKLSLTWRCKLESHIYKKITKPLYMMANLIWSSFQLSSMHELINQASQVLSQCVSAHMGPETLKQQDDSITVCWIGALQALPTTCPNWLCYCLSFCLRGKYVMDQL